MKKKSVILVCFCLGQTLQAARHSALNDDQEERLSLVRRRPSRKGVCALPEIDPKTKCQLYPKDLPTYRVYDPVLKKYRLLVETKTSLAFLPSISSKATLFERPSLRMAGSVVVVTCMKKLAAQKRAQTNRRYLEQGKLAAPAIDEKIKNAKAARTILAQSFVLPSIAPKTLGAKSRIPRPPAGAKKKPQRCVHERA